MSKKIWIPIAIFVLILIVAVVSALLLSISGTSSKNSAALAPFAQCLAQKGAVMYGAYWCPHCHAEKALFGDSFKYVNYVECTQQINKCIAANIQSYPTWIYPDGKTYVGTQSLQDLASQSSCTLPAGF